MCWFLLGLRSGAYHFGSLWPWHWLLASFLGLSCLLHIFYITANFPQICLMLDQFLWGHSSRDCDISCCTSLHLCPYLVCVRSEDLCKPLVITYVINTKSQVRYRPYITPYLWSIGMDSIISEPCYSGAILQMNYKKMTITWSFSYNAFVKFHGKKLGSHSVTVTSKSVLLWGVL